MQNLIKILRLLSQSLGLGLWLFVLGCSQSADHEKPTVDENPVSILRSQSLASVDFGTILYNQNKTITLTIVNDDSSALMGPAVITGADFSIANQHNCTQIEPGQKCIIKINFSGAGKSGPYLSVLSLSSLNIDVLGSVTPPSSVETVALSQSALDFGVVGQKDGSLKTITITNTSQISLNKPTAIGSSFSKPFDSCSNTALAPGKSCLVKIYFKGTGKSGLIQENFSYGSVASVSLSAEVQPPGPLLEWKTSSGATLLSPPLLFNLGSLSSGGMNKNIKIKNIGSLPTNISSADISGDISIVYSTCLGVSLAPKKECLITVRFNADSLSLGVHSGALSFAGETRLLQATVASPAGNYPSSCLQARMSGRLNLENNQSTGNYMVDPDGIGPIEPVSVYCIHTPSETWTEVFDLSREPNLTNEEVLAKLNKFTQEPLVLANIFRDPVRDGVQGVSWYSASNNLGLSFSMDKFPATELQISIRRNGIDLTRTQGALTLHSENKNGCDHNWGEPLGCFQTAYKNDLGFHRFSFLDSAFGGGSPWNYNDNGDAQPLDMLQTLVDKKINNIPIYPSLTAYGRFDSEGDNIPTRFYTLKLAFRDFAYLQPVSCAQAKTKGALNLAGTTGSGIYVLDHDGNTGSPPAEVYCNMNSSGQATITSSCLEAKHFGQKSINNDALSGLYLLDVDGLSSGTSAENFYCDMSVSAIDNFSGGGYTLVGVFNISDGPTTTQVSMVNPNGSNIYLEDSKYQMLMSHSSQLIIRSQQSSNEKIFRILKPVLSGANCHSNLNTARPYVTNTGGYNFMWSWREPDCNFSGADYTFIGMTDNIYNGLSYQIFNLAAPPHDLFRWLDSTMQFSNTAGAYTYGSGNYDFFPRQSNEKFYLYLK